VDETEVTDTWYLNQLNRVRRNPQRFPDWQIRNDKLYVHRPNPWIDPLVRDLDAWKFVVPAELRTQVLEECHNPPQAGHFGREKTYKSLSRCYYWPGMRVDAARFVKSCLPCQRNKPLQTGPQGLMYEKNYAEPWTEICTDIMGPLPRSKNQFKYVLVVQDVLTKYVIFRPLRQATGPKIGQVLEESVFHVFGCPKVMHSDNGKEYENKVLNGICEELGIRHSTIPPYHAQANPAERVNRTLKRMLRTYLEGDHRLWDEHLAEFAFAINTSVQDSTKFSPCFLNFGRDPAPVERIGSRPDADLPLDNQNVDVWADRVSRLEAFHDLIKRNLSAASSRQAEYYNRGRKLEDFNVGDLVMRKAHHLSRGTDDFAAKLAPQFDGPFKIAKVLSPNVYELETPDSRKLSKVHVRFLKRFQPPNDSI